MSFRRPTAPKIRNSVPKPKRTPRKISNSFRKPKINRRTFSLDTKKPKKKKQSTHGICYECRGCKGKVLFKRITKSRCKQAGGKSWKGQLGCEAI